MEKSKYIPNRLETTRLMGPMVDKHWAELREAKEKGRKVAWSAGPGFLLPYAMGMKCHFMAGYAAYCGGRGATEQVLEAAEDGGDLIDTCSYHKLHTGMFYAVENNIPIREDVVLPIPDLMLSARLCSEQSHYGESLSQRFGVRVTGIDFPIPTKKEDLPEIEKFVIRQHKEILIPTLEDVCGKPFDYDEMRRILKMEKEACLLRNECWEYLKKSPAMWTLWDYGVSIAPIFYMMGNPIGIDYYKKLLAELKERDEKNIYALGPDGEKFRIMWDGWLPWGFLGIFIRKFIPYGVVPICGRYPWEFFPHPEKIDPDADDIIENWIKQWYSDEEIMWHNSPRGGTEFIGDLIEEYSIDGVIYYTSKTCRAFQAHLDIKNIIERKYGIPGVVIDADMIDKRMVSEKQVDTRLEAFIERMDALKR